jgi:hypothetical protein
LFVHSSSSRAALTNRKRRQTYSFTRLSTHLYFCHNGARLDNRIRQTDLNLEQYCTAKIELHTTPMLCSIYEMVHSVNSLVVPILLLTTLALGSSTTSYGSTYAMPSIPTLTSAILGPPFVNPPSFTAYESQFFSVTKPLAALTSSTNTATIESSTRTSDFMTATGKLQATSSISTTYTGFETTTATSSSGETPILTMERVPPGCAATGPEAIESGECDQTVVCVNAPQVRALRPTPVIDSGSMPLRGRLRWTWWAC